MVFYRGFVIIDCWITQYYNKIGTSVSVTRVVLINTGCFVLFKGPNLC